MNDSVRITCDDCGFRFCINHRYPESHSCRVLEYRERAKQSRANTSNAKRVPIIGKEPEKPDLSKSRILKKPKSAKNEALAAKLALMKLKQSANGDTKVAMEERLHFNLKIEQKLVPMFFNKRLQVGRVVDILVSEYSLQLRNKDGQILGLIHQSTDTKLLPSRKLSEYEAEFDNFNASTLEVQYS